jgi:hypothetical protein
MPVLLFDGGWQRREGRERRERTPHHPWMINTPPMSLSSSGAEFGSPVTGTPNPLVITAPATVTLLVPTALSSP